MAPDATMRQTVGLLDRIIPTEDDAPLPQPRVVFLAPSRP